MESWLKISLLLCTYGFLKSFRPSEPYVTLYLLSPWKQFSEDQVNQEIYPVWIYSSLVLLVIVFLSTDIVRYKPVIVLGGLSGVAVWCLLIWSRGLPLMQLTEFLYGLLTASDVAYYTYMYAKVDKEYYQKVTSYTRTAYLVGQASSGVVAQIFIAQGLLNYYNLNFITLASVSLATLCSLFLPSVKHSIYFHQPNDEERTENVSLLHPTFSAKICLAYSLVWKHFIHAFSNSYVVKWSLWWAVSTCGCYQILTYSQMLWEIIDGTKSGNLYNGAVVATYTFLGATTTFLCGWLSVDWQSVGEAVIGIASLIQGISLVVSARATSIWTAYISYIVFGITYNITVTIAKSEVAKHIHKDSYALVFGINNFFALLFETLLTLVIVSDVGFAFKTRVQFVLYGFYFIVFAAVFFIVAIVSFLKSRMSKPSG